MTTEHTPPAATANLQGIETEKVGYKNPPKSQRFKKGFDPKRNVRGVPKDAVAMRKRMRQIAAELIGAGDTEMTRLDAMLRQLWTSRNPAHSKLALQVLDPKILIEQVELTATVDLTQLNNEQLELIANGADLKRIAAAKSKGVAGIETTPSASATDTADPMDAAIP